MTFSTAFLANLASGLTEGAFAVVVAAVIALVARRRRRRAALTSTRMEPFRIMSWKCPDCGKKMVPAGLVEAPMEKSA